MTDLDNLKTMFDRLKAVAPEVISLLTAQTEEEYAQFFDSLIERAVCDLEANAKNYAGLEEVGLTAALSAFFNGMPGLTVTREGHSNGHVDLTIHVRLASPIRRRLAEAKIDRGPENHVGGMQQLINRYSTGRDKHALMIAYVKLPSIATRVQALRSHLNKSLPCGQVGACSDHPAK